MKPVLLPGLLLAALLIGAQGAVVLHTFEHDPGAPPGKVCSTCVTVSQLAAGSIDSAAGEVLKPARQLFVPAAIRGFRSAQSVIVRQRGPPPYS